MIVFLEMEEGLQTAQAKTATKEVNPRWQEWMSSYMDANTQPDETFVEFEEYFHLNES
jgi:L-rhamnose mutarotase